MEWSKYLNSTRLRNSNADPNRKEMSNNLDNRNPFESDFGRVVFSAAARRLHDKTQVFPLTTNDNIHSRLTHSMEVMNIGLSFSIYLSSNQNFLDSTGLSSLEVMRKVNPILKTSCLVHDIGNPPFGHFGEEVYQDYFARLFEELQDVLDGKIKSPCLAKHIIEDIDDEQKGKLREFLKDEDWKADYTKFDGNAEGLRVLTKLQYVGDLYGLNLTYGSLGATLKYPNLEQPGETIAKHKHGVFRTECDYVNKVADGCGLIINGNSYKRHPLAFLMEAADSICYLVMDIDDAVSKSWMNFEAVYKNIMENVQIDGAIKEKIRKNKEKNQGNGSTKINDWVMLRTTLLSHLMEIATNNFVNNLNRKEEGEYPYELIEDGDFVYKVLKDLAKNSILNRKEIVSLEVTGRSVITGLFDMFFEMLFHQNEKVRMRAKTLISRSIFKTVLHEHYAVEDPNIKGSKIEQIYNSFDVKDFTVEERFRLLRDYVACMTDKFAISQYQKISGQKF